MTKGSLEHILFITLTVSIDYQRDASVLWYSSRKTFEDPKTRYLFNQKSLHKTPPRKIIIDMQKYKLSKKPKQDANIWRTVGVTFHKRWEGNPYNFLKNDKHFYNKRLVSDYPFLRGPKISSLWLRILKDNVGVTQLKNLDKASIPVDIHVARATLMTGVIRGTAKIRLDKFFKNVRKEWFESVKDLKIKDRPMIALDVDKPLWILSKYELYE